MFIHYHKFYMDSESTGLNYFGKASLWTCPLHIFFPRQPVLITGPWLNDVTWHGCSLEVMVMYPNWSVDPTIMFIAENVFLFLSQQHKDSNGLFCAFLRQRESRLFTAVLLHLWNMLWWNYHSFQRARSDRELWKVMSVCRDKYI